VSKDILQEDVRAIWRMSYFEDVQAETTDAPGGVVVTYVLKEKPALRKIYVSGHEEVGFTKVNEVLDLKKEQILDLAKIKKNQEKNPELYLQRGLLHGESSTSCGRDSPGEWTCTSACTENSKVEVRRVNFTGKQARDRPRTARRYAHPGRDLFSAVTSSGTYREDGLPARDLTA